jgi:O-acetylserine/cysteine efflux transporter
MNHGNSREQGAGHAMGLFVALSFGSAYPVGKHILGVLDPVLFSTARYLLAGSLMLLVLGLQGPALRITARDLGILAGLGFLGYTVFHGVWSVALTMTSPAKAVVLVATTPIFGALFASFGGERLSLPGWTGVLLAFAGVCLIVNNSLTAFNPGEGSLLGDAGFVFIAAVWALYGAVSRPCVLRLGAWRTTAWCAFLGSLILAPFAVPGALAQDWQRVDLGIGLGFAHTTIVVGCFGLAAWSGGLARLGLTRIAAYLYLSPVVGVSLSGLMLGEWLSPLQIAGAGIVLAGVALTQFAYLVSARDRA